ncbi:MAG: DUF1501 domain-containing protein [Verrucomicrobiota bacterium]
MNNCHTPLAVTRRDFLKGSMGGLGMVAFSGFAPSFLVSTAQAGVAAPETGRQILVLVQLAGGNDGLNTCIPFQNDEYYRLRPDLAIKEGRRKLTDELALHPSCEGMERLWKEGDLSIIQNVGYPNPNRSHFRSTEIWETATDSDVIGSTGWIGRYLDNNCNGAGHSNDPDLLHIGDELPGHFMADEIHSVFGLPGRGRMRSKSKSELALLEELTAAPASTESGNYLQHMIMDSIVTEKRVQQIVDKYKPQATYPGNNLGRSLNKIAAMVAANMETRIFFVSQGGYDTHANQLGGHASRLTELSTALAAFQQDLKRHKLDDQVLTVVFSEFGRRPNQNGSKGTDHGTAAPLFVMGGSVENNLIGQGPDLVNLKNKDLQHQIDFRQVYSTIIQNWLRADPKAVLGGSFSTLPFLRA